MKISIIYGCSLGLPTSGKYKRGYPIYWRLFYTPGPIYIEKTMYFAKSGTISENVDAGNTIVGEQFVFV